MTADSQRPCCCGAIAVSGVSSISAVDFPLAGRVVILDVLTREAYDRGKWK
jgi:hypothetical protein